MHNSEQARRLDELAAAARTSPNTDLFFERLIGVLKDLFVAVEDIRGLLNRKVKDFYTVEELADSTGRSAFTVRRWIKEGMIEATRVEGTGPKGKLLIARSELAKLLKLGLAGGVEEVAAQLEAESQLLAPHCAKPPATDQPVTLNQMAAIVNVSKRTLERYKDRLPPPATKGRPGQADAWCWSQVRGLLQEWFNRQLPEHFPVLRPLTTAR